MISSSLLISISPGTHIALSVKVQAMDQQQQGPAKPENFRVRPMTSLSEFSLLFEWAVAEGWRPGVYDAETYYNQDPTGYYLAELDGVPIGAIGTIKFGEDLASITQYIVKPPFRGKGYGYRMWQEVLKKIGDRNLVLESVAAQRSNYEKSGFKSSWQTIRFRGVGRTDDHVISNAGDRVTLTSVDKVNFDDLCAFDQKVSGVSRPVFLKSWINQPGSIGLVAVESIDGTGQKREYRIVGYGCSRLCYEEYQSTTFSRKIAPIYAETSAVGSQLCNALVATVPPGVPYYIDAIDANEGAMQIVIGFGVENVEQVTHMFTKWNRVQQNMVYGLTDFEIGF
ncbi:uncharacterized protein LOC118404206 [Branchiostoma floridae]|uniref:Uncharacterized protein LOC118404206 n=1 Tax=Branchiostoma floridae TaxID=7739 RepID=A0A9J7HJB0_BRAFL|nr:uncharacterized protein LOC118404206 [Branchiostoma floridae]